MKTEVVNIKNQKCDIYCGRPSFFGNPFQIGRDGTRDQVIEKYREWFIKRLTNHVFRDRVSTLKGKRLGCWCKPFTCHCDVIAEYLNES
jgi:hypothetical protein